MKPGRCLVEYYKPTNLSKTIIIPDSARADATHRYAKIVSMTKKPDEDVGVKEGDIILFQSNEVMINTQKYIRDGKTYMNLLLSELLFKINDVNDINLDTVSVLGEYALLQPFFMRRDSGLLLPEDVKGITAAEFVYFRIQQAGPLFGDTAKVGQEVVCNLGRVNPIFFTEVNGASRKNKEMCYVHKSWIDGIVEKS
jgi:co-chaperonin GroES (HSP10)